MCIQQVNTTATRGNLITKIFELRSYYVADIPKYGFLSNLTDFDLATILALYA